MSDTFGQMLRDHADVQAAASQRERPDPLADLALLTRRIRVRRATRTVGVVAGAAAVVGGIALGAAALSDRGPLPPVVSPTVSVSPSPEPSPDPSPTTSPTPTSTATPAELLGTVSTGPLFPTAEPLPRGLLARTTDEWLIVDYTARGVEEGAESVRALYLVGPEGERYQVPDLRGGVQAWKPGSAEALVIRDDGAGSNELVVVDLEDGAVVSEIALADALRALGWGDAQWWAGVTWTDDGTGDVVLTATVAEETVVARAAPDGSVRVLTTDDQATASTVSPWGGAVALGGVDGVRVIRTTDSAPLAVRLPPGVCEPGQWVDEARLVITCGEASDGWVVRLDGGAPLPLGPLQDGGSWATVSALAGDAVVVTWYDEPLQSVTAARVVRADGTSTPIDTDGSAWAAAITPTRLALRGQVTDEGWPGVVTAPTTLVNPETGASRVLIPTLDPSVGTSGYSTILGGGWGAFGVMVLDDGRWSASVD